MTPTILATTEEALKHLGQHQPSNDRFELAVKDAFTWKGKPDVGRKSKNEGGNFIGTVI